MPDIPPPPASAHSGRPFVVVLILAIAVWASALIPRDRPPPTTRPFHVTTGSAPDLAEAIRAAPRAIVFVDAPTSSISAVGRGGAGCAVEEAPGHVFRVLERPLVTEAGGG